MVEFLSDDITLPARMTTDTDGGTTQLVEFNSVSVCLRVIRLPVESNRELIGTLFALKETHVLRRISEPMASRHQGG